MLLCVIVNNATEEGAFFVCLNFLSTMPISTQSVDRSKSKSADSCSHEDQQIRFYSVRPA